MEIAIQDILGTGMTHHGRGRFKSVSDFLVKFI
jgi:hypothetical protein